MAGYKGFFRDVQQVLKALVVQMGNIHQDALPLQLLNGGLPKGCLLYTSRCV